MNTTITLFTETEFKKHLQENPVFTSSYETAAGAIWVQSTRLGIFNATFPCTLSVAPGAVYRRGELPQNIILTGTDFQIKVWHAALRIPHGATVTYSDIASAIGRPKAHRAVANALGDNKIVYFIPCHRVLRKNGKFGGYRYGVDKKLALLNAERLQA